MWPEFKTTSIAASDVSHMVDRVLLDLEDKLREEPFGSMRLEVGVQQVGVAIVAVHSDDGGNARLAASHRALGDFIHPITKKSTRCLTIPVPINPDLIRRASPGSVPGIVVRKVLDELNAAALRNQSSVKLAGVIEAVKSATELMRVG